MPKTPITADLTPMGIYTPAFRLSDGDLVLCSGIVPVDDDGNTVGVGDAEVQTRQVLTIMQRLLAAAGAEMSDVAHLRVFSTDMNNRKAINKARLEFFADPLPASTHVQVVRLVDPEWLIEMEATAFVPR
jgi:2-iminobutanoate/2-iminopropanoate deaminase